MRARILLLPLFGLVVVFAVPVSPAARPVAFLRATGRRFAFGTPRAVVAPSSSRFAMALFSVGITLTAGSETVMGRTMRPRFSVSRGQTWWRWHYTGVRSSVLVPIAASVASLGPGLAPRGADRIPVSITAFRSAGNAPLSVSGRNSSHRRCHFFLRFLRFPIAKENQKGKTSFFLFRPKPFPSYGILPR